MNWSVSEAKARLSELLGKVRRAPQIIENRGEEIAVVLSVAEYERLKALEAVPRETPMQVWLENLEQLKAEAGGDLSFPVVDRRAEDDRHAPDFGEG